MPIPYSICLPFRTKTDRIAPSPRVYEDGDLSWPELVDRFRQALQVRITDKLRGHLFCPTRFTDCYRKKSNATKSSLILIDVDGEHGGNLSQIEMHLRDTGLAALLYTSFSHTAEKNKFRVVIPVSEPLDYNEHVKVWNSVNVAVGRIGDTSKVGCESGYFMPHSYVDRQTQFVEIPGSIMDGSDWLTLLPDAAPPPEPPRIVKEVAHKRIRSLPSWNSLDELKFIKGDAIQKYLSLPQGSHHCGIFAFMMSVISTAAYKGYSLSAADVADIAAALDQIDGGWYSYSQLHRDAERALDYACVVVVPQTETDEERHARLRREYAKDIAEMEVLMNEHVRA